VGTTFGFGATGFKGNEVVSYWLTSPDGLVYETYEEMITSSGDGRVDVLWSVPGGAPAGTWVMTIKGLESGVARFIQFEVS
jgi:hypothetical protein